MEEDDDVNWEQQIRPLNHVPERSMVVIRDSPNPVMDDFSVFPPINHENLFISSFDDADNQNRESQSPSLSSSSSRSASSSSFSLPATESDGKPLWTVSDFDEKSPWKQSECSIQVAGGFHDWWKLLLVFLRSKIKSIVSWFSGGGHFRSFYLAVPAAASLIWWWMHVRARRRRCKGESTDQLRKIIKEKDEKIVELLHQIAQMNALLIKLHTGVTS